MSEHSAPAVGAAAASTRVREAWEARFGGIDDSRVKWGYGVWACAGVAIAVPEIWAFAGKPGFKTISETVGHLERLWNPTAIIVVALLAVLVANVVKFSLPGAARTVEQADGRTVGHTKAGRFTWSPDDVKDFPFRYLPMAFAAVILPSVLVATLSDDQWILGYVMYGLIATFAVAVPSVLAFVFKREVPFATLFQTIADLERRSHLVAMVVVAGLTVLLVHLSLYPWPDIFKDTPTFGAR
jgi:hypothetical protein